MCFSLFGKQEQAEAMKRYIREVVIPEYAKNFNKGLSAEDIKFYGKIRFDRDRSDNELNMHCRLFDCQPKRPIQQKETISAYQPQEHEERNS